MLHENLSHGNRNTVPRNMSEAIVVQLRHRAHSARRTAAIPGTSTVDPWTDQPRRLVPAEATLAAVHHLKNAGVVGVFDTDDLRAAWPADHSAVADQHRMQTACEPHPRYPKVSPFGSIRAAADIDVFEVA